MADKVKIREREAEKRLIILFSICWDSCRCQEISKLLSVRIMVSEGRITILEIGTS